MPYVYNADGSVDWVDEDQKDSSTGGSTAVAEKDEEPSVGGGGENNVEQNIEKEDKQDTAAGGNQEFADKYLKGFTPTPPPKTKKVERKPGERAHSSILGPMPDIDRPSWAEETAREKEEVKKFLKGTASSAHKGFQQIPTKLLGALEVAGAYNFKYGDPYSRAMTTLVNPELAAERDKAIDPYLENLTKEGTDEFGRLPGWKPNWVGGEWLSEDGAKFKEMFGHHNAWQDFGADILSSFAFDVGVNKLMAGAGLIRSLSNVSHLKGVYQHGSKAVKASRLASLKYNMGKGTSQYFTKTASKEFKKSVKDLAKFTLYELAPDAFESVTFFRPGADPLLDEKRFWVHKLPTQEMQEYAWAAITAETDSDFNWAEEQLKEIGFGFAGIILLRTTLMAGNRSLRYYRKGLKPEEAIEKASKEVVEEQGPQMDEAIDQVVRAKAVDEEAVITRKIERDIDTSGRNISQGIRAGARNFAEVQSRTVPEIERLTKEFDELPDRFEDVSLLEGEIVDLQKSLNVKDDAGITKRLEELGQDYDKFEALEKPVKLNNVIDEIADLIRLKDFQGQLNEAKQAVEIRGAKGSEIEKVTEQLSNAGIGFSNSLNDARILVNSIEEALATRSRLIDLQEDQLVRDPRYPDITSTGKYREFPGELGKAYRELQHILQTAEVAQASGNVNEDLIRQLIKQADEVNQRIVDNGGLAQVVSEEVATAGRTAEELLAEAEAPKTKEPQPTEASPTTPKATKIEAPIDQDPRTGDLGIDTDAIGAREGVKPETPVRPLDELEELEAVNRDFDGTDVPKPDDLKKAIVERTIELEESQKLDDIDSGNRFRKASSLNRQGSSAGANAAKLTDTTEGQALLKVTMDQINKENPDLNPALWSTAIRQLGELQGGSADVMARKIAEIVKESGDLGKELYAELPKVVVTMSTLDQSLQRVLRSLRDVRQANAGVSVMGKGMARRRFIESYNSFRAHLTAINHLFQGVGNTMRAFGPAGQVRILDEIGASIPGATNIQKALGIDPSVSWTDPKNVRVAINNVKDELKKLGDNETYSAALKDEVRKARVEADEVVESFMRDFDEGTLTKNQIDGMELLMENFALAKGDMSRLKDVVMTQKDVMANLHTGHVLSNWALPISIPTQGYLGMSARLAANTGQYWFSGKWQQLLVSRGLGDADEMARLFAEARLSAAWLRLSHLYWGKGLEAAHNSFLFNRGITDPLQARRADLGMTNTGMSREDQILKSLAGGHDDGTWVKWLKSRAEGNPDLLKKIDAAATLGRVFRDYTIPGEGWRHRGFWANVGAPVTQGLRNYPEKFPGSKTIRNIGAESTFPGGERVNMTLWSQFASAGDEAVTAMFLNGAVHADAVLRVEDLISDGVIPLARKSEAISQEISKRMAEMYKPVKAGMDQEVIGFSILDERALELVRKVNQTEELTGPLASVKNAVETLRNDKNPAVSFTARFIFPIINSPLVAVKQAAAFAYGGELARMPISVFREGGGYLTRKLEPDSVLRRMLEANPYLKKNIVDFESYYFSKDPKVRDKAWNSFALAAGIQALAASIIWNPDIEFTSGLDDTYKPAAGRAERFQALWGTKSIPYRYIPLLGEALAFQTTMRDIIQFNPDYDALTYFQVFQAALSTQIMDMPGVAGLSRVFETIKRSADGDPDAIPKLAQEAWTRLGDPYYGGRKTLWETIDSSKPIDPSERFKGPRAYKKGSLHKGQERGNIVANTAESLWDWGWSLTGKSHEYTLAPITDYIWGAFKDDPDFRLSTRKAVPYGKPEEVVRAATGPWYNPLHTIFGRYVWGNNNLTDPVNSAILRLNIMPVDNNLYRSFNGRTVGIAINDRELNNFNHFFNTEYTFEVEGKTYVGINSYLQWLVKQQGFTKETNPDSPYKIGGGSNPIEAVLAPGASTDADWIAGQTRDNKRRMIIKSQIDEQKNRAKVQFLMGNIEGQRFKASDELKQLVLEAYSPIQGGSN